MKNCRSIQLLVVGALRYSLVYEPKTNMSASSIRLRYKPKENSPLEWHTLAKATYGSPPQKPKGIPSRPITGDEIPFYFLIYGSPYASLLCDWPLLLVLYLSGMPYSFS